MNEVISQYLPKEALQGEDIPYHIIWKNISYDKIIIHYSNELVVEDVYNVDSSNYSIHGNQVIITKLQVEGYIGIVFKTKIVDLPSVAMSCYSTFYFNDKFIFHSNTENGILYRPILKLTSQPKIIKIEDGVVDEKIILCHRGRGTAVVTVKLIDDSGLKIKYPNDIEKTIENFHNDLLSKLALLIPKYPKYNEFLEPMIETHYDDDEKILSLFEEYGDIILSDEDFTEEFADSWIYAYKKNLDVEKQLINPIVNYIHSSLAEKIIFEPFMKILHGIKSENILSMDVCYANKIGDELGSIRLEPITINTDKPSIELFKLFSWE